MNEIIKLDPRQYGLDPKKGNEIEKAFQGHVTEMQAYRQQYEDILTKEVNLDTCKDAGNLRKKLVKVRTSIAAIHKAQKEFYLSGGRFVDAWKNKETIVLQEMESKLEEFENYFVNQEKERISKLQKDREEALKPYGYENAQFLNLGEMDDMVWENFLAGAKTNYENVQAAKEAAEKERLAKEEQERRAEEERKKEFEQEQAKQKIFRERLSKLRGAKFEAGVINFYKSTDNILEKDLIAFSEKGFEKYSEKINSDYDKTIKEEQKAAKEQAERLKKAEAERLRIANALKAKEAAEKAEREAREKAAKAEQSASDKEKLKIFSGKLSAIDYPELKSVEANAVIEDVKTLINKVQKFISEKIDRL